MESQPSVTQSEEVESCNCQEPSLYQILRGILGIGLTLAILWIWFFAVAVPFEKFIEKKAQCYWGTDWYRKNYDCEEKYIPSVQTSRSYYPGMTIYPGETVTLSPGESFSVPIPDSLAKKLKEPGMTVPRDSGI